MGVLLVHDRPRDHGRDARDRTLGLRPSARRSTTRRTTRCSPTGFHRRIARRCTASIVRRTRSAPRSVRSSPGVTGVLLGLAHPLPASSRFPTLIIVVLGLRLKDPIRGRHERAAAGGDEEAINTEEAPPSHAEAWRMCWKIESAPPDLHRHAVPGGVAYRFRHARRTPVRSRRTTSTNGHGESSRPAPNRAQIIGLIIGAKVATKLAERDPGSDPQASSRSLRRSRRCWRSCSRSYRTSASRSPPTSSSPSASRSSVPGILASLSLAIPPRARAMGFSMASLWILPGLLMLPMIGWIADTWSIRIGDGDDGAGAVHRWPGDRQRRQRDLRRHRPGPYDRARPGRGCQSASARAR